MLLQDIIISLQKFWIQNGCAILQPYDVEMGAGTFHPVTVLRSLGTKSWNVAFVQPSRRPVDSRFAEHPNRTQHYYQFQVVLKPSPDNIQQLYLQSLKVLGIDYQSLDVRFIEDDWESPTLGAFGLGWEVWCNGMEVSQFTYMQQLGSIDCRPVVGEITYGLERLALYVQGVNRFHDIRWSSTMTYEDVDLESERQFSHYNTSCTNKDMLFRHFEDFEMECARLVEAKLPIPAYDFCIKANHIFNLLDARKAISTTERAAYIAKIRNLARSCCKSYLDLEC